MNHEFVNVLCCVCSVEIQPNPANMCVNCLRNDVDITEGINRSMVIHSCRSCGRFLCPPWQNVALESKELLAACMRKIPGLSKLRVVDATWIWTEPHSMRLKIKITVQKEVAGGAILQQAAVVDFAIKNQQCKNCEASYAQGVWHGVAQVRQRVSHKRTFYLLEQILLKHHAHSDCINIITYKDGMDFYFKERGPTLRFIDFLEAHVPLRQKHSRKLVSADFKSAKGNFKDNYLIELVPVCKDDLISLPKELAKNSADINPLCLVKTVAAGIHVIDPQTGERHEVSSEKYWRWEFSSLMQSKDLEAFVVLEVEAIYQEARQSAKKRSDGKKMQMAEVVLAKEADLGKNDIQFQCKTHIGHLLKVGDIVMGYDITRAGWAITGAQGKAESMCRGPIPDVVIVRKDYTKKNSLRAETGGRAWELRKLDVDATADQQMNQRDERQMEQDYETFLQEIEADREFRSNVNLYKKGSKAAMRLTEKEKQRAVQEAAAAARQAKEEAESGIPSNAAGRNDKMENGDGDSDWESDGSDDEAIKLDELLNDLDIDADEAAANSVSGAVLTKEEALAAGDFDYQDPNVTAGFAAADIDVDDFDFSSPSSAGKAKNVKKAKMGKGGKRG